MAARAFDLTGKVAIVTGGNGGIGLGMAHGLADAGASIAIAARDPTKSQAAVDDLARRGARTMAIETDVTDPASVARMVAATLEGFGRIDVLVNNAGMSIRKPAHELALAEWHTVIDTNLTSALICAQAVYPAMKRAGGGKIISIGSMTSIFGAGFAPAYAASKGGIVQLTKSLACSWAADNIQANAVLPGWIDTALTQRGRAQVPQLNENVLRRTPAQRWGTIDDMAGIAVFLASSASDFVTGAAIPVDGGFSAMG
ncbi:2-deoxy-D-gluconate 3-dehydrogenase [Afipia sp. P52-10]|uniref:SDR family NAD(P)-dependent oxidoreductase n=1 Tax=Afipia sp. P52-10 TaxID=1429916 RepID=UPI0003DF1601|nr:glucose 1-dehydrogenase [Afipia sp. P52-10]ETR75016.1 2-deoxy-D-gluconate 3-dehydrogenase [Afipia sp. P52-10]